MSSFDAPSLQNILVTQIHSIRNAALPYIPICNPSFTPPPLVGDVAVCGLWISITLLTCVVVEMLWWGWCWVGVCVFPADRGLRAGRNNLYIPGPSFTPCTYDHCPPPPGVKVVRGPFQIFSSEKYTSHSKKTENWIKIKERKDER